SRPRDCPPASPAEIRKGKHLMSTEDKTSLHDAVFRNTSQDPAWLGYWLMLHQRSENLNRAQLAERLGTTADGLVLLCLCRTPRSGHFLEDLKVVCARSGATVKTLAHVLRQQQNLQLWEQAGSPSTQGWLMAASDRPRAPKKTPGDNPGDR